MAEEQGLNWDPIALERHDSIDSDLSYISATYSLDDAFIKGQHDDVVESLQICLLKHGSLAKVTVTRNVSALIKLVENRMDETAKNTAELKEVIANKNEEIKDLKQSHDNKIKLIMDEYNSRFEKVVQDQEKQLSAAVERAVNARRQTASLQSQLTIAMAKLDNLEQKYQQESLASLREYQTYSEKSMSEREDLITKINSFEEKTIQLSKQIDRLTEEKLAIEGEVDRKGKVHKNAVKELEKTAISYQSRIEFAESELNHERLQNQQLWNKNKSQAQQIAILKARLEFTTKEITHRTKMFSVLKSEKVEMMSSSGDMSSYHGGDGDNNTSDEMLKQTDTRMGQIREKLKERRLAEESMDQDLKKINNSLQLKSNDIQTTSDRVTKMCNKLKQLDEQILNTLNDITSREESLKVLQVKLQRRERQLSNLALQAHQEKIKAYQLDTTLRLSQERERTASEKIRNLKREEHQLNNDCAISQAKLESLISVLHSRRNIINQLESEQKKTDLHLERLFDETVSRTSQQDTKSFKEEQQPNISFCSEENSSVHTDLEVASMVMDSFDINDRFWGQPEAIDEREKENYYPSPHVMSLIKPKIHEVAHSDTDSGVSLQTPQQVESVLPPMSQLQSTPKSIQPPEEQVTPRDDPKQRSARKLTYNTASSTTSNTISESSNADFNTDGGSASSMTPAVSINIFQTTGRVRHNSLPSSASRNRYRYRTKLQDPNQNQELSRSYHTHEQSSQTASSSFLANRRKTIISEPSVESGTEETSPRRSPADGTI